MRDAYVALHRLGHAHSVEVFDGERLVGGIYGVAIGRMFFGESMFSAAVRRLQGRAGWPGPSPAQLGLAADRCPGREPTPAEHWGAEHWPRRGFCTGRADRGTGDRSGRARPDRADVGRGLHRIALPPAELG